MNLNEFLPSNEHYNWDFLKTTGTITENKHVDKKTGLVTITEIYNSNSGMVTIESTESYYDFSVTDSRYSKLKDDLAESLKNEDYLQASKIKEAMDKFKGVENKPQSK